MPQVPPRLTESGAEDLIHGICFKTGPPRLLGAELEWLVFDAEHPALPVSHERLADAHGAARALPLGSRVTVEPGGQLELSSAPATSLTGCVDGLQADLAAVRRALRDRGLVLRGLGQDPRRPQRRMLASPRYDAMETYFDRTGPAGRAMMRSSASVQVCVDSGHEEPGPLGHGRRWRLAHLLGAVLVAAFANSPAHEGPYAGWRCARQGIWSDIDTRRSLAPALDAEPRGAWTRQALDTEVMCVRTPGEGVPWAVPRGLTFRDWVRSGGGPRPPTAEDLDYHLTTLFPPVRPRGHLELRMIDAQPGDDGWVIPVAVVHALFDDPEAAETAYRVAKGLADTYGAQPAPRNPLWRTAARDGLSDPELRAAARACFRAATEALPRLGAGTVVRDAVAEFTDRHVARGRCPADERSGQHAHDPWSLPAGEEARS
ncbi:MULTISPECIES: ergothioneine biosynthesis glutamate--cysteine ligase EgtA [unclassified Streptomyces]|uniref:ergothioneine biosynthesis glutamate--cysteine ligase EgtA n=1 Tax=unclassified Streptomyces TaxID=2593676 RepID=UPI000DC76E1E|nr:MULTISPECIES: ergothioneine biosynthesis glutamate--cysteine ligase EgtA [unclassified Streptomyces]AWZ08964.1 ergothioneine biosynthesis glutamate--cysteine ligase EgtA [Streptomyces sp. ICC4]AWZ16745.1 ergothioneine biosynthesis glutamate--cysteine ligase EgtA [Streptomyces sp. ICC1]